MPEDVPVNEVEHHLQVLRGLGHRLAVGGGILDLLLEWKSAHTCLPLPRVAGSHHENPVFVTPRYHGQPQGELLALQPHGGEMSNLSAINYAA
jgi:hypothetical protein